MRRWIMEKGEQAPRYELMRWGRKAEAKDIEQAANDLLAETDAGRQRAYLWIFHDREFPLDSHLLRPFARNEDRQTAWAATRALSRLHHPTVRALALELAQESKRSFEVGSLLERNFVEGDFTLIESLLEPPMDREVLHGLGISVKRLAEAHPSAESVRSLTLLYEKGPCALCRHGCVKLLLARRALPDWIRAECAYDADLGTRKLVQ